MALKGKEKALIFLSTLGDDVSAKVLSCLPDKLSNKITEELNSFKKPGPEAIAIVFKELVKFAFGRFTEKPKLAAPVESAAEVEHLDPLSQLGRKQPKELLELLQNEQPQTTAFILNYLSPAYQDAFYEILSPGRKNELKQLTVDKNKISNKIFEKINEKLLVI